MHVEDQAIGGKNMIFAGDFAHSCSLLAETITLQSKL